MNTVKKRIVNAFIEPVKNTGNLINLLIGGILTFFPLINFIPLGYLATRLKKNIEQDKSPVKWDENISGLFIKGAILTLISAAYLAVPVFLMFLAGRLMLTLSQGKIMSLFYFRGQALNIIGTILLLVSIYFLPFAICMYLEDNDIKQGFNLPKISEKLFIVIKEYSIAYLVMTGLLAVSAAFVLLIMNAIAGFLISGFVFFYAGWVITGILSKFFPRKSITISLLEVSGDDDPDD